MRQKMMNEKELEEGQYFFPKGKEEIRIINEIFDNELIEEVIVDHFPEIRRNVLIRIGDQENIHHFPANVTGQTIVIGGYEKYFTVKMNLKNLEINIIKKMRKWDTVVSLKMPLIKPVKTGIRKQKEIEGPYKTEVIISTMNLFIQFMMKKDIFKKYKRYEDKK